VPEWTPAGVCILGWSGNRSRNHYQYFRFEPKQEPESTLRSVQEPINIWNLISEMMLFVEQSGIN